MIPMLPRESNWLDIPIFYKQIVDNLEMRGGHHEAWHSHKRDPSVCWMCDLIEVSKIVIRELELFISKSALDIETELIDQELKPEEVTVNYNLDDEPVNGSQDSSISLNDPAGSEDSTNSGSESSS